MASVIEIRPGVPVEEVARICNRNFKSVLTEMASTNKNLTKQSQSEVSQEIDSAMSKMEQELADAIDDMNDALATAISDIEASMNKTLDARLKQYDEKLADLEERIEALENPEEVS